MLATIIASLASFNLEFHILNRTKLRFTSRSRGVILQVEIGQLRQSQIRLSEWKGINFLKCFARTRAKCAALDRIELRHQDQWSCAFVSSYQLGHLGCSWGQVVMRIRIGQFVQLFFISHTSGVLMSRRRLPFKQKVIEGTSKQCYVLPARILVSN